MFQPPKCKTSLKNASLILISFFLIFNLQFISAQIKTHTRDNHTQPDYNKVFPDNSVNRIEISITTENWLKLTNQLTLKFGKSQGHIIPGPPPKYLSDSTLSGRKLDTLGIPPWEHGARGQMPGPPPGMRSNRPPFPGGMKPPIGGMRPPRFDSIPDIYVPVTIRFEGKKWENVGFRFKGNSSLMMSWMRGIKKLPFRLKFNKFKDSVTLNKNQKFYGFNEITFSNNMSDNSFLHEKLTDDLFRNAGLKAPHSSFYEVYFQIGDSLNYSGLYTAIEIVEDALLKNQFGTDTGNCYKPEMPAGAFAEGTFDKKTIQKKNNKKKADYSDIYQLYSIINSPNRISNPIKWKLKLDSVFDIPVFIKWLAINNVIQNWDTYGLMAHNYYLYHNPINGKFTWIPWDNNEALSPGRGRDLSLSLSEISNEWPLIRYILDIPEYEQLYRTEMGIFINTIFNPNQLNAKIDQYYTLITPSVLNEKDKFTLLPNKESFYNARQELIKHIASRYQSVQKFLKNKNQ